MKNYVKTKAIISGVCHQSGLSATELSGVLSECLAELRSGMLEDALLKTLQIETENEALKAELAKLQKPEEEADDDE